MFTNYTPLDRHFLIMSLDMENKKAGLRKKALVVGFFLHILHSLCKGKNEII